MSVASENRDIDLTGHNQPLSGDMAEKIGKATKNTLGYGLTAASIWLCTVIILKLDLYYQPQELQVISTVAIPLINGLLVAFKKYLDTKSI